MRRQPVRRLLWFLSMLLLLSACQPIQPIPNPSSMPTVEATEEAKPEEEVYAEPGGRFTVPVPTNWTVEERGDYAVITSPEGAMAVYVMALENEDLEAAVAEGWARVRPDFDLPIEEVIDQPVQRIDRAIAVAYETGDEERFVMGDARLHDGVAYLTLYDGDLATVQRRVSQLQIIGSGFDILALEGTDLSALTPRPIDDALIGELEAYIERAMAQYNVPGAAVAIVQDGEIVYAQGFGIRNPATGEPMTPETRMMIGSTSKTLTTLLMATLADEGVITWETPVVEILPDFAVADPDLSERITLENMVCACTGVPRRDLELIFNADDLTAEDVVKSLSTFEFFTDFGEAFQYSNQMVAAGGYAAGAAAAGSDDDLYAAYATAVQERILEPMGMDATTLAVEEVLASRNYATPHTLNLDMSYSPLPLEIEAAILDPIAPAGAYWSNVLDMARYLQMQLAQGVAPDGAVIASPENLAVTWTPQVPISANASYGLGWVVSEYRGQPILEHGGNTAGFTSDLAFLPEAGVGISVLTNGRITNFFNEGVRYRLLELLFDQPAEAETQIAFAYDQLTQAYAEISAEVSDTLDAPAAAPYLGAFANDALGEIRLALSEDANALMLDAGEFRVTMRPLVADEAAPDGTPQRFLVTDVPLTGAVVRLTEDAQGGPTVALGAGAIEYVFTPVP
jgi:CubicO group peptidase (beta-lactamase class C family)